MAKPRPDINDPNRYVFYRYKPSLEAAIIFVIAFALLTILHSYQIGKKRTWYFIPLALGGLFEVVGYIGRVLSHYDQWDRGPFIMQSVLLLVAPALFAASIYIILGRIILMCNAESLSPIPQKWLTAIFVTGDVISFMVQGAGGGVMGSGTAQGMKTGENMMIAGLFAQLLFFSVFVFVSSIVHFRLTRMQKGGLGVDLETLPWRRHLYALYGGSALILVRSTFRVVEYLMGNAGYLLRHEVFLYVFDAVLMLAVMGVFAWVHPSQVTECYGEWREREKREESAVVSE